jgi:hypothetical protein
MRLSKEELDFNEENGNRRSPAVIAAKAAGVRVVHHRKK